MNKKALNKKVITSVVLSLMIALAMMPGMAFATAEDSIAINPLTKTVYVGDEITMSATVSTDEDPYHVEWSSSNTNVATISKKNAKLLGLNAGTTTITAKLFSGTTTLENQEPLATATMDVTIVETEAYGFQGTGGQTMKLTKPSDIIVIDIEKDEAGEITGYVNEIENSIAPESGVYQFKFTMSAGMNNFKPTVFEQSSLPYIKILNADDSVAANLVYGGYDATSKTITLNVPAGELNTKTDYVLRFGAEVRGNSSDKTLGVPVSFNFTTN